MLAAIELSLLLYQSMTFLIVSKSQVDIYHFTLTHCKMQAHISVLKPTLYLNINFECQRIFLKKLYITIKKGHNSYSRRLEKGNI